MRASYIVYILCFWTCIACAQLSFYTVPQYLQLFPRDSNNYGHFEVRASAPSDATIRSVVSEMLTGKAVESFTLSVKANAIFTVQHTVPACLKEYKWDIFLKVENLDESREKTVMCLVAGDFFIVDGQSNAECPAYGGSMAMHDSLFYNPFNRVIGADFAWATGLTDSVHPACSIEQDCIFRRPSSSTALVGDFGFSGIWPMTLQYQLANATGIPNCLVNGSEGATGIALHFASHTPSISDSLRHSGGPRNNPPPLIYDRIYKKLYANNAVKAVKAIFWYQGESDGNLPRDSSAHYGRRFQQLYTSWKSDYPSLKKIFVMQINLGCGGQYHNLVREIQRRLPESYPDVTVLSTVGEPITERSNDLCHYTVDGYVHLAKKILPLAEKYLYDFPLDEALILPANILKASYTGNSQICLEFDKDILAQESCVYTDPPNAGTVYLKDYFFRSTNDTIHINSLYTDQNKLYLNLHAQEKLVDKITYLPQIFSALPNLYAGPWILNANNNDLGAYAFTEFPVFPPKRTQALTVYPNPASSTLTLDFENADDRTIFLYDMYGRIALSTTASSFYATLNVAALFNGVYLLSVTSKNGTVTSKVMIWNK